MIYIIMVILNGFDYCATLLLVKKCGYDIEMNPLFRWMLQFPWTSYFCKMVLVTGAICLLYTYEEQYPWIRIAMKYITMVYAAVCVLHVILMIIW